VTLVEEKTMMYGNKLAAAIRVNGRVLREFKDTVYIPFGTEYSILIKNLNTVRAIVNVTVDGVAAVDGGLIVPAGGEIDLERFVKTGNLSQGNRFKFIERNSAVEQHRGVGLEDGLINIGYQFEQVYNLVYNPNSTWTTTPSQVNDWFIGKTGPWCSTNTVGTSNTVKTMGVLRSVNTCSVSADTTAAYTVTNDAGITVPGSTSNQQFVTASSFPTETQRHNLIIRMLGETAENRPVAKPVTVKNRPRCVTCNLQNKATASFCNRCGTALEIFA
jgi:hypothetical protein